MKTEKQLQGIAGEDLATNLLLQKGYRILERNWHCGHLEVDIIAETDDYLVIVEVKTRKSDFRCTGSVRGHAKTAAPDTRRHVLR